MQRGRRCRIGNVRVRAALEQNRHGFARVGGCRNGERGSRRAGGTGGTGPGVPLEGRVATVPALAAGHDIAVRADSCIDSSWSPVRVNAPASGRRLAWTNDTSWPPRGVKQSPRTVPGRRGRRPASSGERSVCPQHAGTLAMDLDGLGGRVDRQYSITPCLA